MTIENLTSSSAVEVGYVWATPGIDEPGERIKLSRPSPLTEADLQYLGSLSLPNAQMDEVEASGLCHQTDPEAFFPEKGQSPKLAKAICIRCPVITECLEGALERVERFGIWGGTTEQDRRKMWRAREKANADKTAAEAADEPAPEAQADAEAA